MEEIKSLEKLAEAFDRVVRERRSVRVYETEAEFDPEAVQRSLERAVLAPNSNNLQLWEFVRVRSEKLKSELAKACFSQPAAATANELIVIVARPDLWKQRNEYLLNHFRQVFSNPEDPAGKGVLNYYGIDIPNLYDTGWKGLRGRFRKWRASRQGTTKPLARELGPDDLRISAHRTAALAAQTFMLSMKAEGYDSCPMEGFDSKMVKSLINLPSTAEINMIIGVGPGKEEGIYGPRLRLPLDDVVRAL